MKDNIIYWVWLQSVLGISASVRSDEIVAYFGDAKTLYFSGEREWRLSGIFNQKQIQALSNQNLEKAQKIIDNCNKNGIKILSPNCADYPSMLLRLPNLPLVLYTNTDLNFLKNKITIAMVGSRSASEIGVKIARALSASLSRSGAIVISGGALGIDSAAHNGSLDVGAKTVAVMGCGFGSSYLTSNDALRREIAKNGALITEYPPNTPAYPYNFPFRNRIISGLSYGTIVIEAGEKSGSLSTAARAIEQGRDVFAVPGNITSSMNKGTNQLLRDGAKPIFNAMDVLEEYAERFPELLDITKVEKTLTMTEPRKNQNTAEKSVKSNENDIVKSSTKPSIPKGISQNAEKILLSFSSEIMQAEEMILKTQISTVDFMSAITELEILGIIEPLAGKNYKIINQ